MQPSSLDLSDDEFLSRFHHGTLGAYAFPHRAHLRLAWLLVRRLGIDRAVAGVTDGIRAVTEQRGQPGLYHDTLTRAWVYAVAAADAGSPSIDNFDCFINTHPELLDKDYLLRYYSPQRLSSPDARDHWLAPDVQPLPGAPHRDDGVRGHGEAVVSLPLAEFRGVLEQIPLCVSVLAAHDAIHVHGVTVSSVAVLARDPALLVVAVGTASRVLPVVRAAGGFAISYVRAGQTEVASRFADRERGKDAAQFHGVPHRLGPFGSPILADAPAWFECRLRGEFRVAEHQVLCGTVVAAGTNDGIPLQRVHGAWM